MTAVLDNQDHSCYGVDMTIELEQHDVNKWVALVVGERISFVDSTPLAATQAARAYIERLQYLTNVITPPVPAEAA